VIGGKRVGGGKKKKSGHGRHSSRGSLRLAEPRHTKKKKNRKKDSQRVIPWAVSFWVPLKGEGGQKKKRRAEWTIPAHREVTSDSSRTATINPPKKRERDREEKERRTSVDLVSSISLSLLLLGTEKRRDRRKGGSGEPALPTLSWCSSLRRNSKGKKKKEKGGDRAACPRLLFSSWLFPGR